MSGSCYSAPQSCNISYVSPLQQGAACPEVSTGFRETVERDSRREIHGRPKIPERSGTGAAVPNVAHYGGPGPRGTQPARDGGTRSRVRHLCAASSGKRCGQPVWPADSGFGKNGNLRSHLPWHCQRPAGEPARVVVGTHSGPTTHRSDRQAMELCEQFVKRGVSGIFFAPLESGATARDTNLAIVAQLEAARIPVVLLDRDVPVGLSAAGERPPTWWGSTTAGTDSLPPSFC